MGGGSEGRQFFRAGPGQHLPGGHLRGAIPTGVDLYLVFGPALGDDGGAIVGLPAPGETEGSIGFALVREGRAEEQPAIVVELRVDRLTAPAHEDVAVRQYLHAALGLTEQLVGVGVLSRQPGAHGVFIDLDGDTAGLFYFVYVAVIEDGDSAVGMIAGVMLEGSHGARTHLEVALFPAELPDDLARLSVDLVNSAGITGGDEQVFLIVYIYGVDVEVVKGLGVRLIEADVVQAVPLEYNLPGLDFDLLDDPVEYLAVCSIPPHGAVPGQLVVDRDESRVLGRDEEFVVVPFVAVSGRKAGYLAVGAVEDHVVALSVARVEPLPPGEHRLSPVRLRPEVHDIPSLVLQQVQPHGLSVVTEDYATVLPRTVLVRSVLRGYEDVAESGIVRLFGRLDDRRVEIRARAEAPRLSHRGGRGGRPDAWGRIAARNAAECDQRSAAGRGPQEPPTRDPGAQAVVTFSPLPRPLLRLTFLVPCRMTTILRRG